VVSKSMAIEGLQRLKAHSQLEVIYDVEPPKIKRNSPMPSMGNTKTRFINIQPIALQGSRLQKHLELVKSKLSYEWSLIVRGLKQHDQMGTVSKAIFEKIVHDTRVHLTNDELAFLYGRYGRTDDTIDYMRLQRELLGIEPLTRTKLLEPKPFENMIMKEKLRLSSFRKSYASSFVNSLRHSSVLSGISKDTSRMVRENLTELKTKFQTLDRKRTGVIAE